MKYIIIAAAVIAVLIVLKVTGDRKNKRNWLLYAESHSVSNEDLMKTLKTGWIR